MDFELKSILISDDVDEQCVDILRSAGIQVVKNTKLTPTQLIADVTKFDGLIVRSATKVTASVIEAGAASRLKLIGRAGTGVDNIDLKSATEHGVIVMNTPGGNTLSAVEHTCTLLLAVSRHVARGTMCVRGGQWADKKHLIGTELHGKTLAIIGLGRIGREVALRMQAFGMKTIGHDPLLGAADCRQFGVEWMTLEQLWPRADYITLHTPLIADTKHLINAETLSRCRRGVRIINCARGGIVDEQALLTSLESGHCAAAGLDVFEQEPPTNTALLQHPNVTSTPHLGASTVDAQTRVAVDIANQFVAFSRQTALVGAVNGETAVMAMDCTTKAWMKLSSALGRLLLDVGRPQLTFNFTVNVVTRGEIGVNSDLLAAAAMVEMVAPSAGQRRVNLVNVALFAANNNIKVNNIQVYESSTEGASLTLEVLTSLDPVKKLSVEGAVHDGVAQWTAVDGCRLCRRVPLTGCLLICHGSPDVATDKLIDTVRDVIDSEKMSASSGCTLVTARQSNGAGGWCVAIISTCPPPTQRPSYSPSARLNLLTTVCFQ